MEKPTIAELEVMLADPNVHVEISTDAATVTVRAKTNGMSTAPRDGTHILAYLYREPDDCGYRGFGEWREIFWKPHTSLGMSCPWHAGDPWDSHSGNQAPEHFGEGVPVAWLPLPPNPIL